MREKLDSTAFADAFWLVVYSIDGSQDTDPI
jgi:hypothetical protein